MHNHCCRVTQTHPHAAAPPRSSILTQPHPHAAAPSCSSTPAQQHPHTAAPPRSRTLTQQHPHAAARATQPHPHAAARATQPQAHLSAAGGSAGPPPPAPQAPAPARVASAAHWPRPAGCSAPCAQPGGGRGAGGLVRLPGCCFTLRHKQPSRTSHPCAEKLLRVLCGPATVRCVQTRLKVLPQLRDLGSMRCLSSEEALSTPGCGAIEG